MNGTDLFIHLLHHLRNYNDSAVLWIMIKNHADMDEISTTAAEIQTHELGGSVPKTCVQRSITRLASDGYLKVRSHKNTKTLVRVNRQAVLDLLRQPIESSHRLPGLSKKEFPFLQAWSEDIARENTPSSPESESETSTQ